MRWCSSKTARPSRLDAACSVMCGCGTVGTSVAPYASPARLSPKRDLEETKVGERGPRAGVEQTLHVVGESHLPQRRRDVRQAVALADRRREWLRDLADETDPCGASLDRRVQPAAHLTRLDAFGQRIDRDESPRVDGLGVGPLERRLAELERAPEESDLPRDPHPPPLAMCLLHESASG